LPQSTLTDSSTDRGAKQPRSIQVLVGWRRYTNGQVGQQEVNILVFLSYPPVPNRLQAVIIAQMLSTGRDAAAELEQNVCRIYYWLEATAQ